MVVPARLRCGARLAEIRVMTQRYVAPIQIVSVKPDYPRYSDHEDRRKPEAISSPNWQPDPQASIKSSHRDFRALGLLLLLAALAVVVVLSITL